MLSEINIRKVKPNEEKFIQTVAQWYFKEWGSPVERTVSRLRDQNPEDMICHYIALYNDMPVASGGIFFNVNLHTTYPETKKYAPMVGMVFTVEEFRRRGIAERILGLLEEEAKTANIKTLYLYTATAESLYKKCGWSTILPIQYKGLDTVVMEKHL